MNWKNIAEVAVFAINKETILSLPLDRMVLQDIKSNSTVKNSLDICSANDEMPYSGQLNTIQKHMLQLFLLNSFPSSSLLPESFLVLLAFAFFFSTIVVMHGKKQTICSLSSKTFSIFLLWSQIFSLFKFPMRIALTAHTWNFLINGETRSDFREFLMRLLRNSFAALNMFG